MLGTGSHLCASQDNIIMPIRGDGLIDGDDEDTAESSSAATRTTYVLHPNCAIEEM
jgi:DNA replication licensing factor MCM6